MWCPGPHTPIWYARRDAPPLAGRFASTAGARDRAERIHRAFVDELDGRATLEELRQHLLATHPALLSTLTDNSQRNLLRAVLSQVAQRPYAAP